MSAIEVVANACSTLAIAASSRLCSGQSREPGAVRLDSERSPARRDGPAGIRRLSRAELSQDQPGPAIASL